MSPVDAILNFAAPSCLHQVKVRATQLHDLEHMGISINDLNGTT